MDDIVSIFDDEVNRFFNKQNLYKWIEDLYAKNNKNGVGEQHPKVSDLLTSAGTLRQLIPAKYFENIKIENHSVIVEFILVIKCLWENIKDIDDSKKAIKGKKNKEKSIEDSIKRSTK